MGVLDGQRQSFGWAHSTAAEFRKEGELLQADYGANFYAAQTFSDIPAYRRTPHSDRLDGRRALPGACRSPSN